MMFPVRWVVLLILVGGLAPVAVAGPVEPLLKLVPKGLIQATASKIIADVWAAIHKAM